MMSLRPLPPNSVLWDESLKTNSHVLRSKTLFISRLRFHQAMTAFADVVHVWMTHGSRITVYGSPELQPHDEQLRKEDIPNRWKTHRHRLFMDIDTTLNHRYQPLQLARFWSQDSNSKYCAVVPIILEYLVSDPSVEFLSSPYYGYEPEPDSDSIHTRSQQRKKRKKELPKQRTTLHSFFSVATQN